MDWIDLLYTYLVLSGSACGVLLTMLCWHPVQMAVRRWRIRREWDAVTRERDLEQLQWRRDW